MAMKRGRGGVEYEEIKLGEGPTAHRGAKVEVRYNLVLNRGELAQENQHYAFRVGKRRAIPGLEYGVEGMRVGGERRLTNRTPPRLPGSGYSGDRTCQGSSRIPRHLVAGGP